MVQTFKIARALSPLHLTILKYATRLQHGVDLLSLNNRPRVVLVHVQETESMENFMNTRCLANFGLEYCARTNLYANDRCAENFEKLKKIQNFHSPSINNISVYIQNIGRLNRSRSRQNARLIRPASILVAHARFALENF